MKKYSGSPVGFENIELRGGFWKDRQETVRDVTIDAVYDRFEETGRFETLKCEWKEGMPFKPHIFWESDVTKWIEGVSYFLRKNRDPELEEKIDILVDRMEKNQDENGYLNAYFTVVEPKARFTRRTDHELYCAGHLAEGALAYYEATGKRKMLDVAVRYLDLIDKTFREEHSAAFDTPGHEEIELALVKLYKFTGEERYKKLAEYFIDTRGTSSRDMPYDFADHENMQSHLPVREQRTAEGHAVRALYLYCGMADLALLNREESLTTACQVLFENIAAKRMHITGGVGSAFRGEAFTFDYDLPEYTAYNETCASIALAMFCRRMWLIDADGKYGDCAEKALYNTMLSGISLRGDSFFYENPLAANPEKSLFNDRKPEGLREHLPILERVKIFDCSCCPPNLIRAIGSVGDYMYSVSEDTIYAHCYMEGDAKIPLADKEILLCQRTDYPYDGAVEIIVRTAGEYAIALRIPGWCKNYELSVNGERELWTVEKGFAVIKRVWSEGDRIALDLSMPVELMEANPRIRNMCGRVAVTRGPLVFCAEGTDQEAPSLKDIRIGEGTDFTVGSGEICGKKLPVLLTEAAVRKDFPELYRPSGCEYEKVSLKLIPYFAWANRGVTEMNVWFLKK